MAHIRKDRTQRMAVYRKARWLLGGAALVFFAMSALFAAMAIALPELDQTNGLGMVSGILQGIVFGGAFAYAARTREVVVGTDGVYSPRVPFGEKYVRWEDFDRVRTTDGVVELWSDDELVLKLDYADDAEELEAMIAEGRAHHDERERIQAPVELEAKDGLTIDAFARSVEDKMDGAGYRGAALTPQVLVRVAEDATISPDVRVVAATVAARRGGDDIRTRVSVLADSTANPGLVDAFDDAARGKLNAGAVRRATATE